jgi:hypothetical protein
MEIGFDVIGDLNLSPTDDFNWENKATSLYCIITGNISSDLTTVLNTLIHLSKYYQGIFYNIGTLEYIGASDSQERTIEILEIVKNIPNIACLHHHVVIIDGVAIIGVNGWDQDSIVREPFATNFRRMKYEDINYLTRSVEKLQKYLDVTKILIVSSAVPKKELYFGEAPEHLYKEPIDLDYCIDYDTEIKISKWVFGTYGKDVDITLNNINYVSNPYNKDKPYFAKRVNISP